MMVLCNNNDPLNFEILAFYTLSDDIGL